MSGSGSHLAGCGRAHHSLVRRGQLGRIEQAWAVDGHVVQSAERTGRKVQGEAPEKAEPSNCHSLGLEPEWWPFVSKQSESVCQGFPSLNSHPICEIKA